MVFMEFNNSRRRLVDLCKYTAGDWRSYETEFGAQPRPLRCHPCSGGVCRSFLPEISDRRSSPIHCCPNGRLDLFRYTLVLHTVESSQVSSFLLCNASLYPYLIPCASATVHLAIHLFSPFSHAQSNFVPISTVALLFYDYWWIYLPISTPFHQF